MLVGFVVMGVSTGCGNVNDWVLVVPVILDIKVLIALKQ